MQFRLAGNNTRDKLFECDHLRLNDSFGDLASRVLLRVPRHIVIVALCLSIGTHWAALQSVAWATMLIRNAQQAPFAEAIAQTFDGNHPCNLCKGVVAAQHSSKKGEAQPLTAKRDLICATRAFSFLPRCADHVFAAFQLIPAQRVYAPPTPPPRAQLA